jgi:hypothetical protein
MAYQSVDHLQNVLANTVFHYTKDAKKASGRALGTLVEIVTFYLLKSWGFEHSVAVERALPEYGNRGISHNVEYSLHPILRDQEFFVEELNLPLTAAKVLTAAEVHGFMHTGFSRNNNTLLATNGVLRNACIIGTRDGSHLVAMLDSKMSGGYKARVVEQFTRPYAIFECKRVGIEEGMKKGPQTIEKAKQGAYVAKSVSSLHKVRKGTGELQGLIFKSDGSLLSGSYEELILDVIQSEGPELLRDFILTVGVVSDHGNWFTSDDHNKEMKVLAQSYDWLLFLTDEGLSEFIHELLLEPEPLLQPARSAFLASYTHDKKHNQFTKVQMEYEADQVLQAYFRDNEARIEAWFNVITPRGRGVPMLQDELSTLRSKNWEKVYGI